MVTSDFSYFPCRSIKVDSDRSESLDFQGAQTVSTAEVKNEDAVNGMNDCSVPSPEEVKNDCRLYQHPGPFEVFCIRVELVSVEPGI